jgi:hypothetical protein
MPNPPNPPFGMPMPIPPTSGPDPTTRFMPAGMNPPPGAKPKPPSSSTNRINPAR